MERKEAERLLTSMRAELVEVEQRAEAIRNVIAGLEALFPDVGGKSVSSHQSADSASTEAEDYPRGRDAVLAVLRDNPGRWFTVQEMADELHRRGWPPRSNDPMGTVRATLARIHKAEEVEKSRVDGRTLAYRLSERDPQNSGESREGNDPAGNGVVPPSERSHDDRHHHRDSASVAD